MPGKLHAQHNEEVCDLLLQNGRFPDWVVTTAYYSAIYYVDHEIFPLEIPPAQKFPTFNNYVYRKEGKPHKLRLDLVETRLPKCFDCLKWLFETCDGARYNSYNVGPEIAKEAKRRLEHIKKECKKA
jgi:hypothetical protein